MTTTRQTSEAELDELIAEEFGVNADYVSELLLQYRNNPQSVAEEWRGYFAELTGNSNGTPSAGNSTGNGATKAAPTQAEPAAAPNSSSGLHATYDWSAKPAAQ